MEIRRSPKVYERWRGGEDLRAAVEEDLREPGVTGYVIEVEDERRGEQPWTRQS